jgi:hypothetical protein
VYDAASACAAGAKRSSAGAGTAVIRLQIRDACDASSCADVRRRRACSRYDDGCLACRWLCGPGGSERSGYGKRDRRHRMAYGGSARSDGPRAHSPAATTDDGPSGFRTTGGSSSGPPVPRCYSTTLTIESKEPLSSCAARLSRPSRMNTVGDGMLVCGCWGLPAPRILRTCIRWSSALPVESGADPLPRCPTTAAHRSYAVGRQPLFGGPPMPVGPGK